MVALGYRLIPLFSPLAALTSLASPSASVSPTRPVCIPLSQRYIRLVIRARISLALQTPSVFMRTMWAKIRGLLEFQVLPSTSCHYEASMAVKWRPTSTEGVAYQLANCAAIRSQ